MDIHYAWAITDGQSEYWPVHRKEEKEREMAEMTWEREVEE
jgi:hypothetical protein